MARSQPPKPLDEVSNLERPDSASEEFGAGLLAEPEETSRRPTRPPRADEDGLTTAPESESEKSRDEESRDEESRDEESRDDPSSDGRPPRRTSREPDGDRPRRSERGRRGGRRRRPEFEEEDDSEIEPESEAPRIIPRAEHPISRKSFDEEALWVLRRLRAHDYKAYLVGGAVRDLYLGKSPKDYDVATDARPSGLKKIFRNCRIIGRRFRIAHVYFPSGMIIEVATLRKNSDKNLRGESGIILRDNVYGNPEQDAKRRDLTINALFYDIETFSILDYVGGVEDLDNRIVRMINDPEESFREDPVRMLRALRHASRTGFEIEPATLAAINEHAEDILEANPSRLLEELFKDLRSGAALLQFQALEEHSLLEHVLPELSDQLYDFGDQHPLWPRLEELDRQARAGTNHSNPVLLAVLLQTLLFPREEHWEPSAPNPSNVWSFLTQRFRELPRSIRISRRDTERVGQILIAYRKLYAAYERGQLPGTLRHKNYLSEALEFLALDLAARGLEVDTLEPWIEEARREAEERAAEREEERREGRRGEAGAGDSRAGGSGKRRRPRGGRGRRRRSGSESSGGGKD